MNQWSNKEINQKRAQLQGAKDELEALEKQIRSFEAVIDERLGNMLDQLSELTAETSTLAEELRSIRDRRLFGDDLIRYLDGAPRPVIRLNLADLPPAGLDRRNSPQAAPEQAYSIPGVQITDIKTLYRKLARRYHPDLARNDADRALSNEQMAEINQAYQSGNLQALMKLAGITIPYDFTLPQTPKPSSGHRAGLTEQEEIELETKHVRQEIARLSRLPIVKLSLDVKLARHQRRDLLGEMAYELLRKVERKKAERDYLKSQINLHNQSMGNDPPTR